MRWVDQLEHTVSIAKNLSHSDLEDMIDGYETKFAMYEEELTWDEAERVDAMINDLIRERDMR